MLTMTRENVAWFESQVIVTVARDIEVSDYEFYMPFELYDMIEACNPAVFKNLETVLQAYREWWKFQEEHEGELSAGSLSPKNFEKNMELTDRRDSTRKTLIDSVKS